MNDKTNIAARAKNRRAASLLAVVVVGFFGFGYALVPLYDVFCEITGLGGRTGVANAATLSDVVDEERLVTVQFDGSVNSRLPWEFRPAVKSMQVHPGRIYKTSYFAKNLSAGATTGQARPSVAPSSAGAHFEKTECFCFSNQRFEGGEGRDMPVHFVIRPDLPKSVEMITLSYTFFNVDEKS